MKWIFLLFLAYLIVGEPLLETQLFANYLKNKERSWSRLKMYQAAFKRTWITAAILVALITYNHISFKRLGFVPVNWNHFWHSSFSFHFLVLVVLIAYFIYFYLFAVILQRYSPHIKTKVIEKLLPFSMVLPSEPKERFWWTLNSLSAFIEEFFYRGFVIFFLLLVFPTLDFWVAAVISVFLDALRYIGRIKALVYVIYSSAFFAFFYGVFHSIYVPMLFHILHDLRVLAMPIQGVKDRLQKNNHKGAV